MNNNNRLSLLKKDSTVPRALLFVHLPGVGFLLLLSIVDLATKKSFFYSETLNYPKTVQCDFYASPFLEILIAWR